MRAQVTSVSFFKRSNGVTDLAQVRYVKAKRPAGGTEEQVSHWIATVQYAFAEPAKDPRTRRWNPLGFRSSIFVPSRRRRLRQWWPRREKDHEAAVQALLAAYSVDAGCCGADPLQHIAGRDGADARRCRCAHPHGSL